MFDLHGARWFRRTNEITNAVQGAGYEFGLPVGARRIFRARIRAREGPQAACLEALVVTDVPDAGDRGTFGLNRPPDGPGGCFGPP